MKKNAHDYLALADAALDGDSVHGGPKSIRHRVAIAIASNVRDTFDECQWHFAAEVLQRIEKELENDAYTSLQKYRKRERDNAIEQAAYIAEQFGHATIGNLIRDLKEKR